MEFWMWRILGVLVLAALAIRWARTEGFMDGEGGGARFDPAWTAEGAGWAARRERPERGVNLLVATPPNALAWGRETLPAAYQPPRGNLVEQEL